MKSLLYLCVNFLCQGRICSEEDINYFLLLVNDFFQISNPITLSLLNLEVCLSLLRLQFNLVKQVREREKVKSKLEKL